MDVSTWTQPKSLTFCERMRLTYVLYLLDWRLLAVSLPVLWSTGATASFSPTARPPGKLLIVSGNGQKELTVTVRKQRVTAK